MTSDEFEKIYAANYKALHSYLLVLTGDRNTADDISQDAFIRFYANADKFKGDCSELTMLCTIGKNLFLNSMRRSKKQMLFEQVEAEDPYKEVFSLHVFGELTFREIAGIV